MKEGLACYFYMLDQKLIERVENKIKTDSSEKINLPFVLPNMATLFGAKGEKLVIEAIKYLSESTVMKDDKKLFLRNMKMSKSFRFLLRFRHSLTRPQKL